MKKLSTLLIVTGIITSVSSPALSAKSENKIYKEKDIFTTQINTISLNNDSQDINLKKTDRTNQKIVKENTYIAKRTYGGLFGLFNAIF